MRGVLVVFILACVVGVANEGKKVKVLFPDQSISIDDLAQQDWSEVTCALPPGAELVNAGQKRRLAPMLEGSIDLLVFEKGTLLENVLFSERNGKQNLTFTFHAYLGDAGKYIGPHTDIDLVDAGNGRWKGTTTVNLQSVPPNHYIVPAVVEIDAGFLPKSKDIFGDKLAPLDVTATVTLPSGLKYTARYPTKKR